MSTPDIVAGLIGALVDVVEPLVDATTSVEAFEAFLLRLGWLRPDNQGYFTEVQGILDLSSELQAALDVVDELTGSDDLSEEELSNALNLGIAVIQKVQALAQFSPSATLPFPLNQSSFWSILADDLIGDLFGSYLQDRFPGVFALLLVLGIIEEQTFPADVANGRAGYTRLRVFWDRLPTLVSDPRQLVVNTYGWGGSFNHQLLLANVQRGVQELGPPIDRQPAFDPALANYYAPTNPALPTIQQLKIPFFRDLITSVGAYAEMGLVTFPIPASGDINGGPVGVVITPYIHGSATATIALGSTLALTLSGGLELSGFSGIEIRPGDFGITLGTASGALDVKAALTNSPSDPIVILGKVDSDHLLVSDVSLSLEVRGDPSAPEVVLALRTSGLELLFDPGSGDGFIQTLLGSDPIKAQADGGVVWSSKSGLTFEGTGTLKIDRSVRKTIGPFTLLGFSIEIQGGSDLELDVAVSGSGTLGPVTVTVQDIGGRLLLEPSAAGTPATQSFGNLNVDYGFKAPTGVGLSVDAGSVHGGGFISLDPAAGRYFGALQLSIYDIAVNAIGLIDTKVPNVDFSFVIVISAQFTPIQLGFGFTLNGVGGIVGINRAIDTNALASLVRAGQSEELLFPKNVVADAPTIVRDLTTVFPATQGKYVFGPLGKLGWGTPTLITGEIGVILEYPALVVVILGEVKCLLPKPDAALVKLNLSVDGVLDFPNKMFAMDADLHDSVINGFPVSGQMAMRVSWGSQPNFVFSIGGFHPAYTPPPNFPKLQPMTLDLGSHGAAKISVSGFFAVTSNTVQVGGSATLHAGGSGITLDASVSVKALFVFQPFSFEADIDASVKISFHGYGPSVHLSGQLDGPSPWHIKGEVCVSIIWWDACLGFDVTFGGNQQVTQPAIDPWVGVTSTDPTAAIIGLQTALSDPGNWSGALVPGTVSSVTRAQGTETLVDPVGGLTVRQKTAPVETANPLTKFGVAKTKAPISFSKVAATLGTGPNAVSLKAVQPVNEFFAPAQFFEMNDGKKLSSAAFEQYQAGYLFATAAGKNAQGGSTVTFAPVTQTFVINSDGSDTLLPTVNYTPSNAKVTAFNKRSAVARGGLTLAGTRRFVDRAFTQSFTEKLATFVIGSSATLDLPAVSPPAPSVRSATLIALDVFRAQHLELASGVQVTALHDMPNPPIG